MTPLQGGRQPEQDEDWPQIDGPEAGSEEHQDLTAEAENRAKENAGRDDDAGA